MAIQFKRSNTPGKVPLIGDMLEGEINFNTHDGLLFFKKTYNSTASLVTLSQTPNFVAGTGITIDQAIDTGGNTNVTINAASSAGSALIKTFNITGEFGSPVLGKAIFVPTGTDTIRSVQLTNGAILMSDMIAGLYRNNELLGFYTIKTGTFKALYSGLNFRITVDDYVTVSVVAGQGLNFSLALLNVNL
jgi:hypothetical protein